MPWSIALLSLPTTLLAICLWSGVAQAQASRTWVSGVGNDANPCSRTSPCLTFAGALAKTAPGGQIDALDPGGFGPVTITQGVTIDGGGQVGTIIVSSANAIDVNAGPSDVVILRNLRLDGISGQGLNGIQYNSGGALHIENCDISGFGQNGILVATHQLNGTLFVNNTYLQNDTNGIRIAPTSGNVRSMLNQVRANGNSGFGFYLNPSPGVGAGTSIIDSTATVNGTGIGATGATLYLGNTTVIRNGTGVAVTGGTILSFKNNMISGNSASDGATLNAIPLN